MSATIEVLDPGALTTVQDRGRPGHAHLGVPRSGALDLPALLLANRLVGNGEDAAGLETTLTGLSLRAERGLRMAVTGAECAVTVDGRASAWGTPVAVPPGAEVVVGPATVGLRSYVAFAGGLVVATVLGSASTCLLSGLGPAALRVGDRFEVGPPPPAPVVVESGRQVRRNELRIDLGPRSDWFTAEALAALDGAGYVVGGASNRIGLRLAGTPVQRARGGELPTEPMVLGAVQVPASGQPLVFLADHPTTGGYPVLGVVRAADLPVCAQARPGDVLTLRLTPRVQAGPV